MTGLHLWIAAALAFCLAAVGYAYAIYPALIWTLARVFGSHDEPAELAESELPSLSILISAYNEQAVIRARIENALALDYPREKLEIVIASDGSADDTARIASEFADRGVRVLDYSERRGKATTLCAAMKELHGKIVLFSDANTHTNAGAARALVRWFADPQIGAVCGRLSLTDPLSGKNVDGMYWKYETFLKRNESRLGALLGSNGAIYAMRADRFHPIPPGTIVDDFVIPLLARLRTGCQIVYDGSAVAEEESAPDMRGEFKRRVRIGAGDWQAVALLWPLLNPLRGWVAFTFLSHKVLRWLCPFFLIAAFALNLLLIGSKGFAILAASQMIGYGLAVCGAIVPKGAPGWKLLRLAHLFVSMNLALLVGFFKFLGGAQSGAWSRTQRSDETPRTPAMSAHSGE